MAAATGFLALAYEIVWYRAFSFVTAGSPITFGLLLGVFLAGLSVGALASGRYCETRERAPRALAGFVFLAQLAGFAVLPSLGWFATHGRWLYALGPVALAATLFGASLPLVAHVGVAADDRAGSRLSHVYLANIIGSAAGSLVVGFNLLDVFPLAEVALMLALAGLALVGVLLVGFRIAVLRSFVTLAAVGAACWTLTPRLFDRLYERLLLKTSFTDDFRFAEVIENKSGVITVTPTGEVHGGGAYDGTFSTSLRDDRNVIFRAYALGGLRSRYKDALMIGLGSGSWAQVVTNLPEVESLTIVEINPGYAQLLGERPEVAWLLTDPRVHLVFDDGRRWLLRHPERRFDLLVMNTTFHWRANLTNLLSREFMELAQSHLFAGGVFFFNATDSDDVLVTAARAFPYALRIHNCVAASVQPLVMDRDRLRHLLETIRIRGELVLDSSRSFDRVKIDKLVGYADRLDAPVDPSVDEKPLELESRESLLSRLKHARTVTDDNMVTEWKR